METAIVLPIIFAVFLAGVDLCRANMIRNTLDNAAFEAARAGTIPGATVADVQADAQATLDILQIQDATISVSPSPITNDAPQITVQIDVVMSSNLYAMSKVLTGKTLSKSCTLTREAAIETIE